MKVYLEAYGCTQNQGETREIGDSLLAGGWEFTADAREADLIVVGTCAVIEHTARKLLRRLAELHDENPGARFVVTGCIPTIYREELERILPGAMLLHPSENSSAAAGLGGVPGVVMDPGKVVMPPVFDPVYYVIPIAQGCVGNCTYCITKLIRGAVRSYPLDEIVGKARKAITAGYREIRLTGQDTAAYGFDTGTLLPELIRSVASFEGDFMVRVGMMNPAPTARIIDDLLEAYALPKVYSFLHLPVQSGSDRILEAMNRAHNVSVFRDIVGKFHRKFQDGVLSTDVIVGYPGEEEEDFAATMELIEDVRPDILNITRFSPRPGTEAWDIRDKMPHGRVVKDRSRRITALHRDIAMENNSRFVGAEMRVMVTESGSKGGMLCRSTDYRPVLIDVKKELGKWLDVEITGHTQVYLTARPIKR